MFEKWENSQLIKQIKQMGLLKYLLNCLNLL